MSKLSSMMFAINIYIAEKTGAMALDSGQRWAPPSNSVALEVHEKLLRDTAIENNTLFS